MGGRNSGGSNKTHEMVEKYERIDSFELNWFIRGDKYLSCKDSVEYQNALIYYPKEDTAEIKAGGQYIDLKLSRVVNIDGHSQRLYFICPYCENQVRHLYNVNGYYMCRNCLHGNYKIQQTSGMKRLYLRMKRLVEKELHYTSWEYDNPGTEISELNDIPRPPYMRKKKYESLIQELEKLQNEYTRLEIHSYMDYMPTELRAEYHRAGFK